MDDFKIYNHCKYGYYFVIVNSLLGQ